MLLISLVLLVAGSIVGGLSESLLPLIVARTLQGLAAGVIPLGISVMRDEVSEERLTGSMALMSASLGVGGALGLPAAALIAEYADWHFLFWTSAGLGVLVTALVIAVVPESNVRTGGTFDAIGALSLSTALITLLLAISKGRAWGWTSDLTIGMVLTAVAAFAVWIWWELRAGQPLVDLRTTIRRQVLLTNLASMVFGFSMFAMTMVFPQVLQLPEVTGFGLGQSILIAGLVMAPSGLVMMLVAPMSSRITNTMGPKITLMLGAGIVATGYGVGILMMSSVWQLTIIAGIIGAGTGLAYGAMPALIMGGVPASETAAANSFNTLMRSLGTSFASAVAGIVLAQMTVRVGPATMPSQGGFQVIMAAAAFAALGALALAAFLPRHRATPTPESAEELIIVEEPAPALR
jgi:MFS family permease